MGSRTQILQCKVLLKLIEFDFPLCKKSKIDWKLPKNQFSIFSVFRKIKNRVENCPKPIFISLKLLKIENWIEIIENWAKMKWTFLYTDGFLNQNRFKKIFFSFLVLQFNNQIWKMKDNFLKFIFLFQT